VVRGGALLSWRFISTHPAAFALGVLGAALSAAAIKRLIEGRTSVTVAHRLSTAEDSDKVLVFDQGRLVERGSHAELLAAGGVYASLYADWATSTRS
jgi:ABC-type transport system involved in Fe-S cluster assembly fused permease/ATPase subunit